MFIIKNLPWFDLAAKRAVRWGAVERSVAKSGCGGYASSSSATEIWVIVVSSDHCEENEHLEEVDREVEGDCDFSECKGREREELSDKFDPLNNTSGLR